MDAFSLPEMSVGKRFPLLRPNWNVQNNKLLTVSLITAANLAVPLYPKLEVGRDVDYIYAIDIHFNRKLKRKGDFLGQTRCPKFKIGYEIL